MTIIYTGRPAPLNGERKLNAKEATQRAKAMKCVRSKSSECQGQVYVGLFFDGTGNNDKWVEYGHSKTLAKSTANAAMKLYSDLWEATAAAYTKARQQIVAAGTGAIQAAAAAYQHAQNTVARHYHDAEVELYRELTRRYTNLQGGIDQFYRP